jgi:hypothetical protein
MKNIFLFLTALMFSSAQVRAQKIFSEGIIQYDVFINNNANPEGIYVITIKNGYIKRELAMNNGFNNVTIYNQKTGKTLSLNVKDDTKYALEITEDELKEKNKRFQNAVFTPIDKTKKLAGYQCKGSTVVYENKDEVQVYYTSDLVPQNETFNNQFPGLKGIPLEYETKSSPTNVIKFVATLIEVKVIDSKTFTIPENYKIVTKEELSQLK